MNDEDFCKWAENDGGPAFPLTVETPSGGTLQTRGMSLRDWFAGQALGGLCANPGGPFQANCMSGWGMTNCDEHSVSDLAYQLADAMLAERFKAEGR